MTKDELAEMRRVDADTAFAAALTAVADPDRNMRVLALRVVAEVARPEGAQAVVAALGDPKRRVREVAIKSAKPFLGDTAVVNRLTQMVQDEDESPRLRTKALFALGGGYPSPNSGGRIPPVALAALQSLAAAQRYRAAVLARLVAIDMTAEVDALLREFVRDGTKEEAVAATRALCGYRLVNWGNATPAELAAAGAEPAGGVHYWVRRDSPVGPPF